MASSSCLRVSLWPLPAWTGSARVIMDKNTLLHIHTMVYERWLASAAVSGVSALRLIISFHSAFTAMFLETALCNLHGIYRLSNTSYHYTSTQA